MLHINFQMKLPFNQLLPNQLAGIVILNEHFLTTSSVWDIHLHATLEVGLSQSDIEDWRALQIMVSILEPFHQCTLELEVIWEMVSYGYITRIAVL